jgi:hypothetical protein
MCAYLRALLSACDASPLPASFPAHCLFARVCNPAANALGNSSHSRALSRKHCLVALSIYETHLCASLTAIRSLEEDDLGASLGSMNVGGGSNDGWSSSNGGLHDSVQVCVFLPLARTPPHARAHTRTHTLLNLSPAMRPKPPSESSSGWLV